jgi:hypothetical protein
MSHLIDPSNEPIHPVLTATWPVADPFELALWCGALAALAQRRPAYISGDMAQLAADNLSRWPAYARAWIAESQATRAV